MENNKKLILILTVIIVVVAIVTFMIVRTMTGPDNDQNATNANTSITNDSVATDNGQDGGDNISRYQYRDGEFIHLVEGLDEEDLMALRETRDYLMSNKMYKICLQSADSNEQEECLDKLKSYQISQVGRVDLCQQLDDNRDSCIINIAVGNNNLDVCQQISDQAIKDDCISTIVNSLAIQKDDISVCYQAIDDASKKYCMQSVTYNHNDLSYCDSDIINNNGFVEECRSIVLINQVAQNNNTSLCEQIPLQEYKDMCFTEFAL